MKTKEMSIKESNKMIAEFMGLLPKIKYHKYNSDWNLLMPVVEKIDGLLMDDNFVTMQMNRTLIEMPEHGLTIEGLGNSWIEATYKAVVEFIKRYNETRD